jgi:hypothetical protein
MDEEDILETTGIQHPLIIYPIYLYKDDPLMVIIPILCTCTMSISFLVYFSIIVCTCTGFSFHPFFMLR